MCKMMRKRGKEACCLSEKGLLSKSERRRRRSITEAKSLPYKTTVVRENSLYIFHARKHLKARSHCGEITSKSRGRDSTNCKREFLYSLSLSVPSLYLSPSFFRSFRSPRHVCSILCIISQDILCVRK